MTPREGHIAVIQVVIEAVRDGTSRLTRESSGSGAAAIREVLREGVAALELQALREPARQGYGDRVVIATRAAAICLDHVEVRERRVGRCGRDADRVRTQLIHVVCHAQVLAMAAVISNAQASVE